jgi:molybdopterin/thiamine biosynthesis adenylyltransferase
VAISKNPFSFNPSNAPVSAVIAANCAVAEAYKHFTPSLRATAVENAVLAVPAVRDADIGHVLLAGAGGLSHGLAWILQWLGWRGSLVIVDFDPIDTSNLNRYFCAFVDDVGADKPATLANFLGKSRLTVKPLTGSYEALRDSHRFDPGEFSHIIAAVDNVSTRLEVQSDLPRSIINAGTNAWSFEASRHSFGASACLACMFPPTPGVNYGRRVRCGERTDGAEQPPVESYSFVNGLAGAYLALELAAATNGTNAAEVSQHYHGSGLHIDSIVAETRNKDSQCVLFCDHPGFVERHCAKFERAAGT